MLTSREVALLKMLLGLESDLVSHMIPFNEQPVEPELLLVEQFLDVQINGRP